MNLILTDDELIRGELLAGRCKGICDVGTLFHRYYTAYTLVCRELKKANLEAWERLQNSDKGNVGTE